MEFGITIFPTDQTLQPIELAKAVEARGFDSLWLPEHSHIPASRETPWGGRAGAPPLPEEYWRSHDVFVSLAAAAAVTDRIKLCTGVTLLAQRDPIWTAKQIASLDVISRGRVIVGVGYGWNKEEMASHGVAYTQRRRLLVEKLELMKALWTQEEASHRGRMLVLEPSWAWPKPVQNPHPPIIFGASIGPKTLADMVLHADGWIPIGRRELGTGVEDVKAALIEAGRDVSRFEVSVFGAKPDPDALSTMAQQGVDRAVFGLEPAAPADVLRRLDQLTDIVRQLTR